MLVFHFTPRSSGATSWDYPKTSCNRWTRTREAPRRVTEAASDLGTGASLNEEGAEGLVLAVGGVGGFDEDLGKAR